MNNGHRDIAVPVKRKALPSFFDSFIALFYCVQALRTASFIART